VIKQSDGPSHSQILLAVWSMKCKRRINTHKVCKPKARLNLWGCKQEIGVHYQMTYSLVVRWTSIQLMLILLVIHGWSTRQLDFVLTYPQADVSTDHFYIEIPKGFEFEGRDSHCLNVLDLKNIYCRQGVEITWDQYLVKELKEVVFEQSLSDECVFYQGNSMFMFMIYADNSILIDPDNSKIKEAMSDVLAKFEVQDKGDLGNCLSVKVRKSPDGSIEFVQMQ
jgi:Reverse transcriptase (RNA-dependent DNA polymerase)